MSDLQYAASNLQIIQERIATACLSARRDADTVTVVAVTKTFPSDFISKAYTIGLRHFGESRVQEVIEKFGDGAIAKQQPDMVLHLVGHLQSNKVRKAVSLVHSIDSVDSVSLATAISRAAGDAGRRIRILLEANTSGEPQKYGLEVQQVLAVVESALLLPYLSVAGLMTIGPNTTDETAIRRSFRQLRECFEAVRTTLMPPDWHVLSMGMSGDYELAVAEGATEIRLGTALFGDRSHP